MKMFLAWSFIILAIYIVLDPVNVICAEGMKTVSADSEAVSAAPGKSVSARSACPAGMKLIGGGGECFGSLVTEGWVSLVKSAPLPDEPSWYIECANVNIRPGEVRARAWAICADPEIFQVNKRK